MSVKYTILFIPLTACFTSCTKPYLPPAIKSVTGYLVIEGVINTGNDSSKFQLSRTVSLSATANAPVTAAQVSIEGNDNSSYPLTGNSAGIYTSAPLNLDNSKQYRLYIKTSDGQEYASDYVTPKVTPPIDTINYAIESSGLQINLNTHDPTNNTRYYRWEYVETWEFHAEYNSNYYSNGDTVLERPFDQQIYYCYSSDQSTNILTGTDIQLSQDVIAQEPITFIASTSEKVETEYSILINQYALSSDAYNFWQNLKQNTEELGSIFDAQPSQINGNIHCITNPSEPVIGYISASTVQSKRIFVNNTALPFSWRPVYPFSCSLDSILIREPTGDPTNPTYVYQEDEFFNYDSPDYIATVGLIPVNAITNLMGNIIGHTGSDRECTDCTTSGTLTAPGFWQ